jgi:hypothetical protein
MRAGAAEQCRWAAWAWLGIRSRKQAQAQAQGGLDPTGIALDNLGVSADIAARAALNSTTAIRNQKFPRYSLSHSQWRPSLRSASSSSRMTLRASP